MHNETRKILHVDDDPLLTSIIAKRLAEKGYAVTSIHDPRNAITEMIRGQFRLILLDIDMPYMNGMELLREIKEYDGGIQVIMLTGLVGMTTVLDTHRGGAEACIFKPVDDLQPLLESLDATFLKIDNWWKSLDDLMTRRETDADALAASR